jgi:O-antigen/teichoic acid export membrane protein
VSSTSGSRAASLLGWLGSQRYATGPATTLDMTTAQPSSAQSTLLRQALKSVVALGARQALVQVANLVGGIALVRLLSASEFGVYAVVSFVLGFATTLGDVGLGASLIRDAEAPTEHDYRVVFGAQSVLVACAALGLWIAAPYIAAAYKLAENGSWLFRAVGLSLLLTSFQTIPAIRLERDLGFDRLSIVEVSQALVFNGVAVSLAWAGFGELTFAYALFARALTGALVIQLVSRWSFGIDWDWPLLKRHLAFGLPYQGIGAVSLIKDSISPVLLGMTAGTAAIGHVSWAGMVAAYPVMLMMILQRLYLPTFARFQGDRAMLGKVVERVIWATNALAAPLAVLTLVLFEPLTLLLFAPQWLEARPLFLYLWIANLFVPTATPMLGLMNALGYSRTAFTFALIWMVSTWLFGVPLILHFGENGFGMANVLVQLTNLALFRVAQRHVPFTILTTISPAWLVAAGMGAIMYLLEHSLPARNHFVLALYLLVGAGIYAASIWTFNRRAFTQARELLRNNP